MIEQTDKVSKEDEMDREVSAFSLPSCGTDVYIIE